MIWYWFCNPLIWSSVLLLRSPMGGWFSTSDDLACSWCLRLLSELIYQHIFIKNRKKTTETYFTIDSSRHQSIEIPWIQKKKNIWNRLKGSSLVGTRILSNNINSPSPKVTRHPGGWPYALTPSIDQTLHDIFALLLSCAYLQNSLQCCSGMKHNTHGLFEDHRKVSSTIYFGWLVAFESIKIVRVKIDWNCNFEVYYTIPFGFTLIWHFLGITLKLLCLA